MKTCNNSNKAEQLMFEAKSVTDYSSLERGCDQRLQRLSYKSTEKLFKKDKAQKPTLFLKTDILKFHNRLSITTKSDGLNFNITGSQLDLLIMSLSHEPTKKPNS